MTPSGISLRQKIGLWIGLPMAIGVYFMPSPEGLTSDAHQVLSVAFLMAVWWITEAVPLYATALVPLVAFPFLGILGPKDLADSYGHHYIYFFMGGFFIAKAIEKWNLHERMALTIIGFIGTSPRKIIFGIMAATAFLSMWISDTASTMVMFPIGMAILHHVESHARNPMFREDPVFMNFSSCLILSIAYAALIGGIATLIGTPPNIVFAGAIKSLYPGAPEVTFFQWMMVGFPLTLVFLPLAWFYLTHVALRVDLEEIPGGRQVIREKKRKLGPMVLGEKLTLIVFCLAVSGWVFRKDIDFGLFTLPGWSRFLGTETGVNDATVAVLAALVLFFLPADWKKGEYVLDWNHAKNIPWGILILFGGGIALASAIQSSGLSLWIGEGLSVLSGYPVFLVVLGVCLSMTFLTQVTSNTAMATVFMPIVGAMAVAMEANPMLFMIPVAMASSCAFMLPVATPPTAIVFGSGYITIPQMVRAGLGLNVLGAVLITLAVYLLAIPVFGLSLSELPPWAVAP